MRWLKNLVFIASFPLCMQIYFLLEVNLLQPETSMSLQPQRTNTLRTVSDFNSTVSKRGSRESSLTRTHRSNLTASLIVEENEDAGLTIPVFYNLYTSRTNRSEVQRVRNLVSEQLTALRPEHSPVYIHSIGRRLRITNTTLLTHQKEGSEMITLHSLWKFCKTNRDRKVVYLHSKGSFHAKRDNDLLRNFMTLGALSKECANLPSSCNVCSSRFSPFPHPHPPGNMFLARCDYVAKLIDPAEFPQRMNDVPGVHNETVEWKYGSGRFSSEHWIGSAPSMKPCDLYTSARYTWGYDGLPETVDVVHDFELQPAPRFHMAAFRMRKKIGYWATRLHRIEEYRVLYNETPDESWWGWNVQFPS